MERAGSSEIGRLLQGGSKSPSFGSGTISDLFQAFGKVMFVKELLMRLVIDGKISGRQSLITEIETLSNPGALFEGICIITFLTSEEETG